VTESDFEIESAIFARPTVRPTSFTLEPLVEQTAGHSLSAHEHQVLEEVGETRSPGSIVSGTNLAADRDDDLWLGVVFVHNGRQSVRQGDLTYWYMNGCDVRGTRSGATYEQ